MKNVPSAQKNRPAGTPDISLREIVVCLLAGMSPMVQFTEQMLREFLWKESQTHECLSALFRRRTQYGGNRDMLQTVLCQLKSSLLMPGTCFNGHGLRVMRFAPSQRRALAKLNKDDSPNRRIARQMTEGFLTFVAYSPNDTSDRPAA